MKTLHTVVFNLTPYKSSTPHTFIFCFNGKRIAQEAFVKLLADRVFMSNMAFVLMDLIKIANYVWDTVPDEKK